jgi:molecular chaperone GrpE
MSGDAPDETAELERRIVERDEALLRMQAELENLRKRSARDVDKARKFALERFVAELLPVKDSMELGIAACDNDGADLTSLREGVELTHKMLGAAIEKFGVTELDPVGEAFNPEFHQAMSMHESDGLEPGRVVMVVQKGYTLNERLVRPAMVIVSK